ncbi:carotenoid 1,2-hydratase [Chromatocurvus halotolerans]|uniref:Hydroxyneurosporene synthase n=1 Tax=Chromatocurvus halotolerans TaxID=1132028 RepID=A0A4R2L0G9_9GAMM|nr:carotenoid 1,2-hydratase [Chromatocurvus halotolerans]TCO77176.1 hydroxyneurosporene synthase [Chromatocurvus halotolerans]
MLQSEILPHSPSTGFAGAVGINGYQWWYIDALSDDGRFGLTIIVFVGSVFSPYYAAARRRGPTDPGNHCAINAVLYNPGGKKVWALTERGRRNLIRDETHLQVGPSAIHWDGKQVSVAIDEITVPLPRRLRGQVRLTLPCISREDYAIDHHGRHRWWPISPACRVSVELEAPRLSWQGEAYFDSNRGSEPLEAGFTDWDWSRATLADGSSIVQYHTRPLDPSTAATALALRFDAQGNVQPITPPPGMTLPTTGIWRIPRQTGADTASGTRVRRTLEDTPFYARSMLETQLLGETVTAFHESLSLDRFRQRWVQTLLPFRMPRNTRPVRGGAG